MKIGIIGAGHIGSTLAAHLTRAGHDVAIANSRGPETLQDLIAELGERAQAASVTDAARFGDLVVVAIPFKDYRDVPADDVAGEGGVDAVKYFPRAGGRYRPPDSA